jgi:hypothetical protein
MWIVEIASAGRCLWRRTRRKSQGAIHDPRAIPEKQKSEILRMTAHPLKARRKSSKEMSSYRGRSYKCGMP